MSKKLLAFAASNSQNSINKKLVSYAAHLVPDSEVILLDLNDFEMPIYSIDRQKSSGFPPQALAFQQHIADADAILISFAEHNGTFAVAYKNIYDWVSRIERNVWQDKPMFLMATSPGARGAKGVLELALKRYNRANKNIVANFSLPNFRNNFSVEDGILDEELKKHFMSQLHSFQEIL